MPNDEGAPLALELETLERHRGELERTHPGKFVVIKGDAIVGTWDTLDAAAGNAVARFGRGPYLIRQIGAPPPSLPASVMYRTLEPA
jgi:hypothetical protein